MRIGGSSFIGDACGGRVVHDQVETRKPAPAGETPRRAGVSLFPQTDLVGLRALDPNARAAGTHFFPGVYDADNFSVAPAGRVELVAVRDVDPVEATAALDHVGVAGVLVGQDQVAAALGYDLVFLAVAAIRPDLVALDKTLETDSSLRHYYAGEEEHLRRRRETPHEYIGVNPAVADASNDPEGATASADGSCWRPSSSAWLRGPGHS